MVALHPGVPATDLARLQPSGTVHRWDPELRAWEHAQIGFGSLFDVGSEEIPAAEAAIITEGDPDEPDQS